MEEMNFFRSQQASIIFKFNKLFSPSQTCKLPNRVIEHFDLQAPAKLEVS